jgi:hypothetical protein
MAKRKSERLVGTKASNQTKLAKIVSMPSVTGNVKLTH